MVARVVQIAQWQPFQFQTKWGGDTQEATTFYAFFIVKLSHFTMQWNKRDG